MPNVDPSNPDDHKTATGSIEFSVVSARMPESIGIGVFSTSVIILGAAGETVLDFLLAVDQPTKVVARVVLPNRVIHQLIRAIEPCQQVPSIPDTSERQATASGDVAAKKVPTSQSRVISSPASPQPATVRHQEVVKPPTVVETEVVVEVDGKTPPTREQEPIKLAGEGESHPSADNSITQTTIQDIYNDLKLPDDILAGSFANKVIVRNTQIECIMDFVSQLFPTPCVSARVIMASQRVPAFLKSLKQHVKNNDVSQ